VRYARQFADGRRVRDGSKSMSRLYIVESTLSLTGSMADHRMPLPPSQVELMVNALAQRVGVATGEASALPEHLASWIKAVAEDLMQAPQGGSTLVVAGPTLSRAVQAQVHLINQKLGNIGKTVLFIDPVAPHQARTIGELAGDMADGRVDTLLMIGVNPAYNAPADVPFADALMAMTRRGGFTASLSTHYDETSYLCRWHIPRTHYLEAWGDVRAFDGTASIIQPLIAPLYGAHSEWELMETALGRTERTGLEIVRDHWQGHSGAADFEQWWIQSLQKGIIANTASPLRSAPALSSEAKNASAPPTPSGIELVFQPDPSAWDGQFANNAWLQEIPRPFTKLTWDNAIAINIRMAEKLAASGTRAIEGGQTDRGGGNMLRDGDMVRVSYRGRQIEAPVILLPGQADNVATLYLGYGRKRGGEVMLEEGKPRGYSAYALRTSDAPWAGTGATITPTGQFQFLVVTRNHHAMSIHGGVPGVEPWLKPDVIAEPGASDMNLETENRKIVRTATLDQFKHDPDVIKHLDPDEEKRPLLSLYPGWNYDHGLQWGMSIDMTACMGCNACIVACQAENNIAVVGKDEVSRQREMHWIRIDDYFVGDIDSPSVVHQPVPCMQCENAPCEYVCPVGATSHSDEGINEMTYNRCIGTRYCSNNCPYKVRRFNFFLFSDYKTPTLKLLHNPDVTVRSRGVMEKCTYCIQRIDRTRIQMEKEVLNMQDQARATTDAKARDDLMSRASQRGTEIVRQLETACQQACPTHAIIFGDIRDSGSEVTSLKKEPTDYSLLSSLTTKPRTTYLARINNPNPALINGGMA
jgi:Fe-S-cluster-containing dehydrogenase component